MGAFAAAKAGAKVIVLEKNGILGGTTILSGCVCWVPNNYVMEELGFGPDVSDDEVLAYLRAADVSHSGIESKQRDYIAHAKDVFEWVSQTFGLKLGIFPATCDYYDLPGAMGLGRSIGFVDSKVDEYNVGMDEPFAELFAPMYDELGIDYRLNTEMTELVRDESGRVTGVVAQNSDGTVRIKADKGVLVGSGGFEHDQKMCNAFLYGPLMGAASPKTNTGDGIKAGMRIGAGIGNMASIWGNPFYIVDENDSSQNILGDYGMYVGLPGAIYVNKRGRRFVNEAAGYDVVTNAMYNYSTKSYSYENLTSWMIFDDDHVSHYGYPTFSDEMPDWVSKFDTLDELAEACGIDAAGLKDEIDHFNETARSGVDDDWGRGAWEHDTLQANSMGQRDDLSNAALGPIEVAPFYAVKVGPGAFGTNGGLTVNEVANVLDVDGEPIEGLYACGNCTDGIFGSIYPGPGGTVGPGFYQSLRAVDDMLGIGILQ
jgi:3-oxosteroid 1-dehydrogenase